jgi:hypothetical protein
MIVYHKMYCIEHKDGKASVFIDRTFLKNCVKNKVKTIICSDCGRELIINKYIIEKEKELRNDN